MERQSGGGGVGGASFHLPLQLNGTTLITLIQHLNKEVLATVIRMAWPPQSRYKEVSWSILIETNTSSWASSQLSSSRAPLGHVIKIIVKTNLPF